MASQKVVSAILVMSVMFAALYVIYATFGTSMGNMRYAFNMTANNLSLSSGWHGIIYTGILYNPYPIYGWSVFWWAGIIVAVAIGVWAVKTVFIDERSDQFGGFN